MVRINFAIRDAAVKGSRRRVAAAAAQPVIGTYVPFQRGTSTVPDADRTRQQEVVAAFLAASREGNFDALLAVLDPDVALRADVAAVRMGASKEVRGARDVADTFKGRAQAAQAALVNGAAGAVWAPGGRPRVVFAFTITGGKIVEIELLADLCTLRNDPAIIFAVDCSPGSSPKRKAMKLKLMNRATGVVEIEGGFEITAPEKSDDFIDMFTRVVKFEAPCYYTKASGDFIARCRVKPDFRETYDAGGILVCESKSRWIKLEFERTDLGYPSIVSVVTKKISDDSNGERADAEAVWLQVVRKGNNWCLHHSLDGTRWKMVRYFHLKMKSELTVGMVAQSPLGAGCRVEFSGFEVGPNTYTDIRAAR